MKVAVFGSWPAPGTDAADWSFLGMEEAFRNACRELGTALAERGHSLVVESDKPHVADRYVVEAYVARAAKGVSARPLVELAFPRGVQHPFAALAQTCDWFTYYDLPQPEPKPRKWGSSHLPSLRLSEAVLTIAGLSGTYAAGSAAIFGNRPLVPVACFGGASARLFHDLREIQGSAFPPEALALTGPWNAVALGTAMKLLSGPTATKAVFVSHSHADVVLAKALVELIRTAFHVEAEAIRCTSVPGYQLPPAGDISDQLRAEIEGAEFVLALVTPAGARSAYVLFELGAAWGLRRQAVPLLAHGFGHKDLPGPLIERNSVDLSDAAQCYSLLKALGGSRLMRPKHEDPAIVHGRVADVVAAAQPQAGA